MELEQYLTSDPQGERERFSPLFICPFFSANICCVLFVLWRFTDSLCIKLDTCLSGDLFPKTIGIGSTLYGILYLDFGV